MKNEIYAALEITRNEFRFAIGKYQINKVLKIIYKHQEFGNWLNANNEVIDIKAAANLLNRLVQEYERTFEKKILKITVVIPEKNTEIKEAISTLNLANGGPARIVTSKDISQLNSDAKDVNYSNNRKVVSIKPTRYLVDDTFKKGVAPIGAVAHKLTMYANVYTVPSEVYNSHLKVVSTAGFGVLNCLIKTYALARQIVNVASLRSKISLLVDWDLNAISLNIFAQETLLRIAPINVGLEKIAEEIGAKIYAKPEIVKKYLFKIVDFKSDNLSDTIIYRKYLTKENKNFELTMSEFKRIFVEVIDDVIRKLNLIIKHEVVQNTDNQYNIYHTGKITEISGFENLLSQKKLGENQMIYYSDVIGGNEIWITALCGIMIQEHLINKNNSRVVTSLGEENLKDPEPVQRPEFRPNHQNQAPIIRNGNYNPAMQHNHGFVNQFHNANPIQHNHNFVNQFSNTNPIQHNQDLNNNQQSQKLVEPKFQENLNFGQQNGIIKQTDINKPNNNGNYAFQNNL
ncbi:cell division protein FtsA [Spiroplasma sabaudiense Ar-1343]|uniref:Cell division protein FtsA n=1 Tax=Spiroplasma sabaudiense Ar-1343 TaxID=1276257 RepID=W6AAC2_9MOLU|nr:hypothetical protein [Spiroplasma sabaudiense]AHI54007.1 cell division protein FtsA [Spiroplasma sabaudiense Ar-1343]